MTEWVYLKHDRTDGTTDVPNDPVVLDDYALRGWHPIARPGPVPFIPSPDGQGGRALDPAHYAPAPANDADDADEYDDDDSETREV